MRKSFYYLLIPVGILGLWIIARITNLLQYYSAPTTANEPTIRNGETFFATSLFKPERFDFICYRAALPMMGVQTVTHRVCGLPGDKIEIRDGDLYVNDANVDTQLTLTHDFHLSTAEYLRLKEDLKLDEYWVVQISPDSVELPLTDAFIKMHHVQANRKVIQTKDEDISRLFQGNYNQDRLGPLIVPKGKYFVLGDNRHNAQDSRYLGFVEESRIVATVLGR